MTKVYLVVVVESCGIRSIGGEQVFSEGSVNCLPEGEVPLVGLECIWPSHRVLQMQIQVGRINWQIGRGFLLPSFTQIFNVILHKSGWN